MLPILMHSAFSHRSLGSLLWDWQVYYLSGCTVVARALCLSGLDAPYLSRASF